MISRFILLFNKYSLSMNSAKGDAATLKTTLMLSETFSVGLFQGKNKPPASRRS